MEMQRRYDCDSVVLVYSIVHIYVRRHAPTTFALDRESHSFIFRTVRHYAPTIFSSDHSPSEYNPRQCVYSSLVQILNLCDAMIRSPRFLE